MSGARLSRRRTPGARGSRVPGGTSRNSSPPSELALCVLSVCPAAVDERHLRGRCEAGDVHLLDAADRAERSASRRTRWVAVVKPTTSETLVRIANARSSPYSDCAAPSMSYFPRPTFRRLRGAVTGSSPYHRVDIPEGSWRLTDAGAPRRSAVSTKPVGVGDGDRQRGVPGGRRGAAGTCSRKCTHTPASCSCRTSGRRRRTTPGRHRGPPPVARRDVRVVDVGRAASSSPQEPERRDEPAVVGERHAVLRGTGQERSPQRREPLVERVREELSHAAQDATSWDLPEGKARRPTEERNCPSRGDGDDAYT